MGDGLDLDEPRDCSIQHNAEWGAGLIWMNLEVVLYNIMQSGGRA